MSYELQITFTDAARALVIDRGANGLATVLTHVAVGDGGGAGYTPPRSATALRGEALRVAVSGGEKIDDYTLQVDSVVALTPALVAAHPSGLVIREVGIYAGDTLFGVWSAPNAVLMTLSGGLDLVLSVALTLDQFAPGTVTVSMLDPIYPDYAPMFAQIAKFAAESSLRDIATKQRFDAQLGALAEIVAAVADTTTRQIRRGA